MASTLFIYQGRKYYIAGNGYYMDSSGHYLHHEILPHKSGFVVDHRDGNRLNNDPGNLRYVTKQQNSWNSRPHGRSGIKGVTIDLSSPGKPYKVQLRINGRNVHLGRFATVEEARLASNRAMTATHGEFARLT